MICEERKVYPGNCNYGYCYRSAYILRFWFSDLINLAGNPVIALFIGIISVILIMEPEKTRQTDSYLVESIEKSGPILLITGSCLLLNN
jgi:H+/gluconate symporter-like permease